jgi:hypothetical protein
MLEEAEMYEREARRIFRKLEGQWGVGLTTCDLGTVALARGEVRRALENYRSALGIALELEGGSRDWLINWCLSSIAIYQKQVGELKKAVELATLCQNQPECHPYIKFKMTKLLSDLQNEISEDDFEAAQEQGRERDLVATAKEMLAILEKGAPV